MLFPIWCRSGVEKSSCKMHPSLRPRRRKKKQESFFFYFAETAQYCSSENQLIIDRRNERRRNCNCNDFVTKCSFARIFFLSFLLFLFSSVFHFLSPLLFLSSFFLSFFLSLSFLFISSFSLLLSSQTQSHTKVTTKSLHLKKSFFFATREERKRRSCDRL